MPWNSNEKPLTDHAPFCRTPLLFLCHKQKPQAAKNRREAIKGLTTWGAMAIFPNLFPPGNHNCKSVTARPVHFVGLGGAGSNVLEHIHEKGIEARYTCITTPPRNNLSASINLIDYSPFGEVNANLNDPANHTSGHSQFSETTWRKDTSLKLTDKMPTVDDNFSGLLPENNIPETVRQVFSHDHKYVLLAGLGGFTGTSLAVQLTHWLKEAGRRRTRRGAPFIQSPPGEIYKNPAPASHPGNNHR